MVLVEMKISLPFFNLLMYQSCLNLRWHHSFIKSRKDVCSDSLCFVTAQVLFRLLCIQAMHLTELSSSRVGSRSRQSHSAGLGHDAHNTRSLPRHFKLSTHQQGAAQSYYDAVKDTLYVCKSIALICQLPYVYAARKFLAGLHR
jgi:hypothetical protein